MKKFELLSPVGDFECLKAAVQNGADSVYLGASSFNARARATNFDLENLKEAIHYAKLRNVSVHLTLNTLIKDEEFEDAVKLAVEAYNFGVDAIIVQDLGLAKHLLKNYPEIPLHASTQMTVHNLAGVKQLEDLGFSRVVLARELSISEIEYIRKNTSVELEVFIHGALCISYSGQCLLSSMIGGRSGNRGLCAQPCRLPYELCDSNGASLDKGYLLSPKDTCGLEYLPELIKMGINSFKIEGRMKTPAYVATVTKIYRKYINFILDNLKLDNDTLKKMILEETSKKNELTGLSDKEELAQVFNRGGFGTGHFSPSPNKNLIYKEKPNNMGIYLGTIYNFNPNKGHITLRLESAVSVGDKISINDNLYTISELMINNQNFETVEKGTIVKIGRMKGNLHTGNKIYRIESSKLIKAVLPTFKEDKNFKKIALNGKIVIKKDYPITLKIWSNEGFYQDLEYSISSEIIPETSINRPITKEDIIKQLNKTGSTEFEFINLEIYLDDQVFIPKISSLNELRRTALNGLENLVLERYTRNVTLRDLNTKNNNVSDFSAQLSNSIDLPNTTTQNRELSNQNNSNKNVKVSILLNTLNTNIDYASLHSVDNVYIPLRFFTIDAYKNLIKNLEKCFSLYIYMPHVLEDKNLENAETTFKKVLEKIIDNFDIKGFVVSHISQLPLLEKYNLELIGNFNLNIYNKYSVNTLKDFGLNRVTLSPELSEAEVFETLDNIESSTELLVYGKVPLMTNHYCYLGKSNKCYPTCDKKCMQNNEYYLKDRKDFNFRILPDNTYCITTIYHNKPITLENSFNCQNIRLDFLDEDVNTMQEKIDYYYNI